MARMPGVRWVGPSPNITEDGLSRSRVRGVVCHIAEGYFDGTIAWQKNKSAKTSSHFIINKDGETVQMVDTADAAWTQRDGNSTWLSIEFVGFAGQQLTTQQIQAAAKVLLWVHRTFPDVPLQLASSPSGRGLGHHSMGYENDVNWGHQFCPGEPIKKQKAGIVSMAIVLKSGGNSMADEDTALTPAQDRATAATWQYADAMTYGKGVMYGTGGPGQPPAQRVWAFDKLNNIHTAINALAAPAPAFTMTPEQIEAIGKATARALLDLVTAEK